jgi:cysteinyl-tRNA synthetase
VLGVLALHDTATGSVAELQLRDPKTVSMYVCGPTVYGPPHVGHGRTTLVYDVLRRYLESRGLQVRHVSNVTDIDDNIINRARREGRDWREVATECEAQWWAAMGALGLLRPNEVPHATEYVEQMIGLVDQLLTSGAAYQTSDGVYLAASELPGYGLLAHQSLDSLRAGARVELTEEKRSSVDFALWKAAKPGEPMWSSPFGEGRPGWHTECVVMSLELLGDDFDLHGGGQDLMFPHHENERAQAIASGHRFTRHWMHNGLVTVSGEKMSKSLGNFTTLAELLEQSDPRAYRLLVLQAHYRSPLEVTGDTLRDAAGALSRLDTMARRFRGVPYDADEAVALAEEARFVAAMEDDLDTPRAIASLFEAVRRAHGLEDVGEHRPAAALAAKVVELFGSLGVEVGGGGEGEGAPEAAIRALVERRDAARSARDFAAADALRADLEAAGWTVEDTPQGTKIHRKAP